MATFNIKQPDSTSFDINLPEVGQVFRGSGGGIFKRQGNDIVELGTGYTASTDLRDQSGNIIKAGTFLSEQDLAGKAFNPTDINFRGSHFVPTTAESVFTKQFGSNIPTFNVADFQTAAQKGLLSGVTRRSSNVADFAPTAVTATQGGTIDVDPVLRAKEVQGEISQGVNTQATGFANQNKQLGGQGMGLGGAPTDALQALSMGLAQGKTTDQLLEEIPGLVYDGDVTQNDFSGSVSADTFSDTPPTINDILSQQTSLRKKLAEQQGILRDLRTQALQENVTIEGQQIPLGLIGQQQQNVNRNLAFREIPLTNQIQALTDQLGIQQDAMNLAFEIQKFNQPDTSVSYTTDAAGNMTAIVYDNKTGEITSKSLGALGKPTSQSTSSQNVQQISSLMDMARNQLQAAPPPTFEQFKEQNKEAIKELGLDTGFGGFNAFNLNAIGLSESIKDPVYQYYKDVFLPQYKEQVEEQQAQVEDAILDRVSFTSSQINKLIAGDKLYSPKKEQIEFLSSSNDLNDLLGELISQVNLSALSATD